VSPVVATAIVLLIVVATGVLMYFAVARFSSRVVNERTALPMLRIEAVSSPSSLSLVVPSSGGQATLAQPIRLFVRNIGRVPVNVTAVIFENPMGTAILYYRLPTPVEVKPSSAAIINVTLSYSQYLELLSQLSRYGYVEVAVASESGSSSPAYIQTLPSGSLSLKRIVISVYIVILNCSDSAGWWVNATQLLLDAENAASRVPGIRIVIINSTSDLYYLFTNYTAIGYAPNGTPVRVYLGGRRAIIVNAKGEPLPLPPQYVRDIDGDGLLEVEVQAYAAAIRSALEANPWILVAPVGAAFYYLSNNGFYFSGSQLWFRYPNGTAAEVDYSSATHTVSTDVGNLPIVTKQLPTGGSAVLIITDRRILNYLITGSILDNGPDVLALEVKYEPRLSINGKSWHNFANEKVVGWGGAAYLEASSAVQAIDSFFGASLPSYISAARGIPSTYAPWFNAISSYLYYSPSSVVLTKAMLHYDDFSTNSVLYLDAGLGRNMPYWRNATGVAYAGNGVLTLVGNATVLRNIVGWADFTGTLGWLLTSYSIDNVTYSFSLSASGSGSALILLGNGTFSGLAAINISVSSGVATSIYLENVSISSTGAITASSSAPLALGLSVPLTSPVSVEIAVNGSYLCIALGSNSFCTAWSAAGLDLNNTEIVPGFASVGLTQMNVSGPLEVYATHYVLPEGRAGAAIPIGNGTLVVGGYSPPQGIVKEYGYSYSQVEPQYIADAAIYYPLYLVLKSLGISIG